MQEESIDQRISFSGILAQEVNASVDQSLELAALLSKKNMTISVIESMTGGGIARKLVATPGASQYFLGGVVAYHSRLKVQYGRVNPKPLLIMG